jgi:hypothetical protein
MLPEKWVVVAAHDKPAVEFMKKKEKIMVFSFHLWNRLPGKGVKKMDDVALCYWSVL